MSILARLLVIVFVVAIVAAIGVVIALLLSKSKKAPVETETEDRSYFDGGTFAYIGYLLLAGFVTLITLGIAFPWMCCMLQRWRAKHTIICGKRQVFDGTGIQLIGNFLLWSLLSAITFGIYSFWMALNIQKWICKHTHFVGEEDNNSYFDGGILGLIGTNILSAIVMAVPFVGFAWSNVIRLRWYSKHTVVDSRRLVFIGTVGNFFVKYLIWGLLSGITLGIYALFVPVKTIKLETENTIDHEHTDKALMKQSEYRNTVQNTVSMNKNYNTEFEMENLKAGINDTTDKDSLLGFANNGLRSAQYLYVNKYAEEQYTAEPFSSFLKASAEAGYAPAMCLYALTHELEAGYKNELLSKAAEQGQLQAMRNRMSFDGNFGLAQNDSQAACSFMEKAVFFADVLQKSGEELSAQEQEIIKKCILRLRKIESDKKPSSGSAGKTAIIIAAVIVAVLLGIGMIGMLFVPAMGSAVKRPAMGGTMAGADEIVLSVIDNN